MFARCKCNDFNLILCKQTTYYTAYYKAFTLLFSLNNSLRYKQNKYPVLLLTQGVNTKYDQYLDQRTHNINNGSHFAATADILGTYKILFKI